MKWFTGSAGQTSALDIDSAEYQYSLDAKLVLYSPDGSVVDVSLDAVDGESALKSADPYLVHTLTSTGTYAVAVSGEGGTVGSYRLKIATSEAWDQTAPQVSPDISGTRNTISPLSVLSVS